MYNSPAFAVRGIKAGVPSVLFEGDCLELVRKIPDGSIDLTLTSPPYCIGKKYDSSRSVDDFISAHRVILPEIVRTTREGGSICWQVGYHVAKQAAYPLDYAVFAILNGIKDIVLRNRIIWTFGFGMNQSARFSGRHETVLWFTKGDPYSFDLDAVRVPQRYPGKRHYKGAHKGQFSGNPKGKNPGDVWEIPNVKAAHIEKLEHPCQFPVALAERLVRALCPKGGVVLDPYAGSASTGVACIINGNRFVGAEIDEAYIDISYARLVAAHGGQIDFRPAEQPIMVPGVNDAVARRPEHFWESLQ